jgi:hypothetical protein
LPPSTPSSWPGPTRYGKTISPPPRPSPSTAGR